MSKLVILITSQNEAAYQVGEAWQRLGAPGVTLLNSYGLYHLQETKKSNNLPDILALLELVRKRRENNLVVLSVVDSVAMADKLMNASQKIMGDFYKPDSGIMFVLDLERAVGLRNPEIAAAS